VAGSDYSEAQASLAEMLETEPLRLRRRSISLGIHPADADDVAQTVALRAWHAVNGVRGTEYRSLCSWLDVIARNTVADLARVRSRRNEIELHDDEPSTDDVEFDAEQKDLLERTFDAIRELPESLRVPLLMSAIEGASADDIAQQLGITAANARQRVSRARRALIDIRRNDR
jgi:RNA polymerase sigma factor (sigma-70 family)